MNDNAKKERLVKEDVRLNSWEFIEDSTARNKFLSKKILELRNIFEEIAAKTKTEGIACFMPELDPGVEFVFTGRAAGFARELSDNEFSKTFLMSSCKFKENHSKMDRAFLESLLRREMSALVRKCKSQSLFDNSFKTTLI